MERMEIDEKDPRENSHRESEHFSETVTFARTNQQRLQPWFRSLPVRQIIGKMHRALCNSDQMESHHMLDFGKILLQFLTLQGELKKEFNCGDDQDHKSHLKSLEIVFKRLSTFKSNEDGEEIQQFLDSVWELHTNGILDLTSTTIPATIVQVCPSRLDNILEVCVGGSSKSKSSPEFNINQCPSQLIPLCDQRPDNYLQVMESLHFQYVFNAFQDPDCCNRVLKFTQKFQTLLSQKSEEFHTLFPTLCQPLVAFILAISKCFPTVGKIYEEITNEILSLLDLLIFQCETTREDLSLVLFMIFTLPDISIPSLLKEHSIRFRKWPWLKLAMRNEDFKPYKIMLT